MALNCVTFARCRSRHTLTICDDDSLRMKAYKEMQRLRRRTDNTHHNATGCGLQELQIYTRPSVHPHCCCWSTLEFSSLHFPQSPGHLHGPIGRNKLQVDRLAAHPQHFPGMPRSATYVVFVSPLPGIWWY